MPGFHHSVAVSVAILLFRCTVRPTVVPNNEYETEVAAVVIVIYMHYFRHINSRIRPTLFCPIFERVI